MARCTNCGSKLPRGATSCPECGVFAGEEVDGRPVPKRSRKPLVLALLVLALLAGGFVVWRNWSIQRAKPRELPVRVVEDRPGLTRRAPGASTTEAEAIRILRRHLVLTQNVKNECIAILSKGARGPDYVFTVVNSCTDTRLGQWRVNARTGEVRR